MAGERFGSEAEWLRAGGPAGDVVLSSRVRFARNFAGFAFPCKATEEEQSRVLELAHEHLCGLDLADDIAWLELGELERHERSVLVERHLISKQHAKDKGPRGVAISTPDERLSVMVNEEDHLRIQVLRSGLGLREAFGHINSVDDELESRIDYAYSPRFGYLTACPTNVGTGIRVSVMMHLPALKLSGELEKVRRAAKAMGLAVRGFYGEGSDAVGDYYQLSNQTTLGRTESELLDNFDQDVVPKVIEYERLARRNLIERRRPFLEDRVWRAVGVLTNARLMKAEEAMEHLSLVRLGVVAGILPDEAPIDMRTLHQLVLYVQPAHLQQARGRVLDQAERRVERASLIREKLADSPA